MKKKMKLQTKLTILIIIVVFISISIITFFVASWMNKNIESTAKTNVMNVAEIVANSKPVIDALNKKILIKKLTHILINNLKI
ncbi:Hypothetical protein RLITU_3449 [Romboutsia lituseburensis]|uniref:hypothetical protein n=1 Tax=Romboutsia lituseburensis TaxID=1537 RepID=UPI000E1862B7|nr:hypothetical protein [Romboutsia lituseburensis]CEH36012.1 Hypothetical protein RLITU_3449 [Romboutsia lituseburensis]